MQMKLVVSFSLLILLSSLSSTAIISANDNILNPNFLNWTTDGSWTYPDDWLAIGTGTMGLYHETGDSQDGDSSCVKFSDAENNADYGYLKQNRFTDFIADDTATLSIWFKQTIDSSIGLIVYWYANDTMVSNDVSYDDGTTNQWTEISLSVTVPTHDPTVDELEILVHLNNANLSTVLLDNVTLIGDIVIINEFNESSIIIMTISLPIISTLILKRKKLLS